MEQRKFWNKLASNYDENVNKVYAQAYQDTVELIIKYINPEMEILDIGCGTGIVTNQIAPYAKHIRGIDISDGMLRIASEKADAAGISNVDYANLTLEEAVRDSGKYDCVIACNLLYFIKDIDRFLSLVGAAMEENGLFISVTDCLGEKFSIQSLAIQIGSALRLMPYMRVYSMRSLKQTIEKNGFQVTEEKNLFHDTPNYFIVCNKQ